jgi:hypothetical protein
MMWPMYLYADATLCHVKVNLSQNKVKLPQKQLGAVKNNVIQPL